MEEYDRYTRGTAIIKLCIEGPWVTQRQSAGEQAHIESVKTRIRETLDVVPEAHINLFGTGDNAKVILSNNNPSSGGGSNPTNPHIRLSYDCFSGDHAHNNGRLSYTLLHEMGHIVDKTLFPGVHRIFALRSGFPLGCLAILTRYHSGGTVGPSEHYADIYADYFYNYVHGLNYNVLRNENLGGCPACRRETIVRNGRSILVDQCFDWRRRWSARDHITVDDLPVGGRTTLRYRALLYSWQSIDAQVTPASPAKVPAIASHSATRLPSQGPVSQKWPI